MKRAFFVSKNALSLLILISFHLPTDNTAQILLVDFGSSPAENQFGLNGWNTIIKSNYVNYSAAEPRGLVPVIGAGELDDYQGVSGSARLFKPGERIIVTWYNNSDDSYSISARISFRDKNNPDENGSGGKWYTMRSFSDYRQTYSEIQPRSSLKTVFNITDKGAHKTDSSYTLVNINLSIEWFDTTPKPNIICDKIELYTDADIQSPAAPTNLTAQTISDSKITLSWNEATDNVGVVEYLVYNKNEVEGYSRTNNYTAVLLESNRNYQFTVTALDKTGNESAHSTSVSKSTEAYNGSGQLINPAQFKYIGAFKLPELFSYGADAMAFCSDGDGGQTGSGAADGYPGSLFVSDLNIPERGFVAEVSIPLPKISASHNVDELNEIKIIQQPVDIRPQNVTARSFVDLWRNGLTYVESEKRLYSSWSIYYTVTGEKNPSLSFCNAADLSNAQKYGGWFIGKSTENPNDAMACDYLFTVPKTWADNNILGNELISGRSREGGLSGLGPTFYSIRIVGFKTPPQPGTELQIKTLLEYGPVEGSDNYIFPNSFVGYNHADWWRDACWIDYNTQAAFVVFGKKGLGNNWYGYKGESMRHDWVIADLPYPGFWETDPDGKGWRSSANSAMMIFYNPDDFASVIKGNLKTYEPQPYAALRFDKTLFWGMNGEIASAAYDSKNKNLYLAEFNAPSEGRIIVHVFKIESPPTSITSLSELPIAFKLNQNYPNPFNPETVISYQLPVAGYVTLKVYDVLGREVATLVNELQPAGFYSFQLSTNNYKLSSGIYFYRLTAGNYTAVRKMILIK